MFRGSDREESNCLHARIAQLAPPPRPSIASPPDAEAHALQSPTGSPRPAIVRGSFMDHASEFPELYQDVASTH